MRELKSMALLLLFIGFVLLIIFFPNNQGITGNFISNLNLNSGFFSAGFLVGLIIFIFAAVLFLGVKDNSVKQSV